MVSNRRETYRIPVDMYLTEYVSDRPNRVFSANVSETGLQVSRVLGPVHRSDSLIQLEFQLPGTTDYIWAAGDARYDALDQYFHTTGLHFRSMAEGHQRLLRAYVMDMRALKLKALLERIRQRHNVWREIRIH